MGKEEENSREGTLATEAASFEPIGVFVASVPFPLSPPPPRPPHSSVVSPNSLSPRLILCGRKHDHVTPLLKELHWLPVELRIIFKILLLTFKALNNLCPSYIRPALGP